MQPLERPRLDRAREKRRDRARHANREGIDRLLDLLQEGEHLGAPTRCGDEIHVLIYRARARPGDPAAGLCRGSEQTLLR